MRIAIIFFCLFWGGLAKAELSARTVIESYIANARADYLAAASGAAELQNAIERFLLAPSPQTLSEARLAWIEARKLYSPTETYRFYGGPIDAAEDGPEGLINSWPLDEAYIDYVVGNPNAGIINNSTIYPAITLELLEGLNEQGGEKNISVGFHAIEFLLWGQDLSASGPGNRSYRDYVDGGARNADRRRTYLRLASAMLVDKLNWVAARWDSANPASYAQSFTSEGDLEALRRILIGPYRMAREELSQERMFVAYDTQSQEEEHSCFSDTTHLDIQFNFLGIRRVLEGSNVLELIRVRAPNLARDIDTQLALAELTIMGIPAPFDNAIFSNDGRLAILRSVESLESLADAIRAGAQSLGVALQ